MKIRTLSAFVITAFVLAACGGSDGKPPVPPQQNTSAPAGSGEKVGLDVTGAGASFPQPIYVQWAQGYQVHPADG